MEFGVFKGGSANFFSKYVNKLYVFDNFQGYKEDRANTHDVLDSRENFNLNNKIPKLNPNVEPIIGWVEDTLVNFLETHKPKINFVHLDINVYSSSKFVLEKIKPYLIILAGFLLKIPNSIINNFEKKIVNIHPSLLPKYGGKGMYGINVHKKVIANKEKESGISIHYVNGNYDEGEIIFQKSIKINYPSDSEKLSKKIHKLEMEYFPKTIEKLIKHMHNE